MRGFAFDGDVAVVVYRAEYRTVLNCLDLRGGGILRVLPLGGAEPSSRSRNVVWFVGPTRVAVALRDDLVLKDVVTGETVLSVSGIGTITTGLVECRVDMRKKAAAFKRAYAMRF